MCAALSVWFTLGGGPDTALLKAAEAPTANNYLIRLASAKDAIRLILLQRGNQPEAEAVAEAQGLLPGLPKNLKLRTRQDLKGLLRSGRVRFDEKHTQNYLVSLNLRTLKQALSAHAKDPAKTDRLKEALKNQTPLIENLLDQVVPAITDTAKLQSLGALIDEIDVCFLFFLDHGFDPAKGPTQDQVEHKLEGLLGVLPSKGELEVPKGEGGVSSDWMATGISIDVGLAQPLLIPPLPIANRHIGIVYPQKSMPINAWLEEHRRKWPGIELPGGIRLEVLRLVLQDQVLAADLAFDLPALRGASDQRRIVLHNVVRRKTGSGFKWNWDTPDCELFIGKELNTQELGLEKIAAAKLQYNPATGYLSVKGALTAAELEAVAALPLLQTSVHFGAALQRLHEQLPRLDLGGFVKVGTLSPRALKAQIATLDQSRESARRMLLEKAKQDPVRHPAEKVELPVARFVHLDAIVGEGEGSVEMMKEVLNKLSETIESDPQAWLEKFLHTRYPQPPVQAQAQEPAVGTPFHVVMRVADVRVKLPAKVMADRTISFDDPAGALDRLQTNGDILSDFVTGLIPLPLDPRQEVRSPVRITRVDFDPAAGELSAECTWNTPSLDKAARFTVRVPLRPGAAFDWESSLREALSGRDWMLGAGLELHFAAPEPGSKNLAANVEVAGLKLSMRVTFRDGRFVIVDWDREAVTALLRPKLEAVGVSAEQLIASARPRLVVSTKASESAAALCFDLWPDGDRTKASIEVRLDPAGVTIQGVSSVLAEQLLAKYRHSLPPILGVKFVSAKSVGDALLVDADLALQSQSIARLEGIRFEGAALKAGGSLHLTEEGRRLLAEKLKLSGPGWQAAVTGLATIAQPGLAAEITATIEGVGEFVLPGIVLGPEGVTVEKISAALLPGLVAKFADLSQIELGPFQVHFHKARQDGDAVNVPVEILAPSVGARFRFPGAKFSLGKEGWNLGPVDADWVQAAQLKERLLALASTAIAFAGAEARVVNPKVSARTLEDFALTFDLEVSASGQTRVVRDNRLGRHGFAAADFSALKELALQQVTEKLLDLEIWKKNQQIQVGPLTFSDIAVTGLRVTASVAVLGDAAGRVVIVFSGDARPVVTWEENEKLLARLRAWPGGWLFRLSEGRVTSSAVELLADGVRLPISVQLPELNMDSVPAGALEIRRTGLRFDGDGEWEGRLWKTVSVAIDGKALTPQGFPFEAVVRRAEPQPQGLKGELDADISGLGKIAIPFQVTREGLRMDRDRAITVMVRLIQEKLLDRLPGGRVTFGTVSYQDGAIGIPCKVDLELANPVDLLIRVDKNGVHGLDFTVAANTALNELLARLDGQSLDIAPGVSLKVPRGGVRLDAPNRRVVVSGKASIGPVIINVANVHYNGRKVDLRDATAAVEGEAIIKDLLGGLGFGPVAIKNVVADVLRGEVLVTCGVKFADFFEGAITARIGLRGEFSLVLPVTFSTGDSVQVTLAPTPLLLTGFEVEIAKDHLGGGCQLTLVEAEMKKLIRLDARITIPFGPPRIVRARGDLILMNVLPAAYSESTVNVDKMEFETTTRIGVRRIFEIDGKMLLRFGDLDFSGEGSMKAFGAALAQAKVHVNTKEFTASAMLNLLLVHSTAEVEGAWSPLSCELGAKVSFGFHALGQYITLVGTRVAASLRPSASFDAIILGQDIKLLDVDLRGITIQRIIDLLLRQPICLTGFKLFASEGGGGVSHVLVQDGDMYLRVTDPATGRITKEVALMEKNGGISMTTTTFDSGGGVAMVKTIDVAADRETFAIKGVERDQETKAIFTEEARPSAPLQYLSPWREWETGKHSTKQ